MHPNQDPDTTQGQAAERRRPFVERSAYRRRRLMDIARLVPVIGALLFAIPLMWPDPDPYPAPDTSGAMPMSSAITYIFFVWGALIAVSYAFGIAVRRWADHWTGESNLRVTMSEDENLEIQGAGETVSDPSGRR